MWCMWEIQKGGWCSEHQKTSHVPSTHYFNGTFQLIYGTFSVHNMSVNDTKYVHWWNFFGDIWNYFVPYQIEYPIYGTFLVHNMSVNDTEYFHLWNFMRWYMKLIYLISSWKFLYHIVNVIKQIIHIHLLYFQIWLYFI